MKGVYTFCSHYNEKVRRSLSAITEMVQKHSLTRGGSLTAIGGGWALVTQRVSSSHLSFAGSPSSSPVKDWGLDIWYEK